MSEVVPKVVGGVFPFGFATGQARVTDLTR